MRVLWNFQQEETDKQYVMYVCNDVYAEEQSQILHLTDYPSDYPWEVTRNPRMAIFLIVGNKMWISWDDNDSGTIADVHCPWLNAVKIKIAEYILLYVVFMDAYGRQKGLWRLLVAWMIGQAASVIRL